MIVIREKIIHEHGVEYIEETKIANQMTYLNEHHVDDFLIWCTNHDTRSNLDQYDALWYVFLSPSIKSS